MAYFQITAKVEEIDDTSYTRTTQDGREEVVSKWQFSLVVPGMRERVLCEIGLESAPKLETMERWELEESWVVLSAESMRALAFARSNARAGEKAVGALVIFQATEVREATPDERRALQQARKVQKTQSKARRAQRAAEKKAAKEAEAAEAKTA